MSILEVETEVSRFSLEEKQQLSSWLLESLEDEADENGARFALQEGGKAISWEQLKQEMALAHEL